MKKIYLAGGWSPWRDSVISVVNNCIWLDPRSAQNPKTGKNLPNWFEIETKMIRECDAIFCYIESHNPSGFGATYEMGMAYALGKPYILINEKEDFYQWGMQTKGASINFKALDEAFQWIKKTGWMGMEISDYIHYEEGVPCRHVACWAHTTHTCEYCGRIGCEGEAFVKTSKKIERKWDTEII